MFKLENQDVLLNNYTARTEKRGKEDKAASSLQFKMTGLNTILDLLDPNLREMLFMANPDAKQDDHDEEYLPSLRFPLIPSIEWNYVGAGYRLVVHGELESSEDKLILINTEIKSFKISYKEGGSVTLMLTVNGHPSEEEAGWIYIHQKTEMTISLFPPTVDDKAQAELDGLEED
jgi:hypothetical protein